MHRRKEFLHVMPKAQSMKENTAELDFGKIKNFCSADILLRECCWLVSFNCMNFKDLGLVHSLPGNVL